MGQRQPAFYGGEVSPRPVRNSGAAAPTASLRRYWLGPVAWSGPVRLWSAVGPWSAVEPLSGWVLDWALE